MATSNTKAARDAALEKIAAIGKQIDDLQAEARALLADARPLIVGMDVERWGKTYRVTGVRAYGGIATVYGVSMRTGKPGKRDFDIGHLSMCKVIKEPD